jgi:hypothetical protein
VKYSAYIVSFFLTIVLFSCKRKEDTLTTDPEAKLSFSQDRITFDTIFTSVGSVTKRLWVYNENQHAVKISSIQLARMTNSSYTIMIDGEEKLAVNDYELMGKDSMLILVKVLIDPQNQSLPYLVDDSIVFSTNGNIQDVDLLSYGQDAFFITGGAIPCNSTWTNTKPYVLTGNVIIPTGCTLTIDKGTRVRLHKDATLTISGTLITQGDKDSVITFKHDNLSDFYEEIPGQWGGLIFLTGSKNNHLHYTEIKNATNAITMQEEPDGDTIAEVKLENTRIKNCSENSISVSNSDLYAINCEISNSAGYLLNASSGGNYYFDFCTLANYSQDFFRNSVAIRLSNQDAVANSLKTIWRNSIVWGDKTEEFEINNNGSNSFDHSAEYSILKTSFTVSGSNTLFNQDPQFEQESSKDFSPKVSSPAINSGILLPSITIDLEGATRDSNPDRGCFEYIN